MIALDATTFGQTGGGTATISHTTSGLDRILFAGGWSSDLASNMSATYNGVAMTKIAVDLTGGCSFLFYLINPAVGTHNVAVTSGSGGEVYVGTASYTGVNQVALDSQGTNSGAAVTTLTVSTTVVGANCWLVGAGATKDASNLLTSNRTLRQRAKGALGGYNVSDSNGIISAGSNSIVFTPSGSFNTSGILVSIAPSGGASSNFLAFL